MNLELFGRRLHFFGRNLLILGRSLLICATAAPQTHFGKTFQMLASFFDAYHISKFHFLTGA